MFINKPVPIWARIFTLHKTLSKCASSVLTHQRVYIFRHQIVSYCRRRIRNCSCLWFNNAQRDSRVLAPISLVWLHIYTQDCSLSLYFTYCSYHLRVFTAFSVLSDRWVFLLKVGRVGFEPTMFLCNGFTVRRLRPSGLPTHVRKYTNWRPESRTQRNSFIRTAP